MSVEILPELCHKQDLNLNRDNKTSCPTSSMNILGECFLAWLLESIKAAPREPLEQPKD